MYLTKEQIEIFGLIILIIAAALFFIALQIRMCLMKLDRLAEKENRTFSFKSDYDKETDDFLDDLESESDDEAERICDGVTSSNDDKAESSSADEYLQSIGRSLEIGDRNSECIESLLAAKKKARQEISEAREKSEEQEKITDGIDKLLVENQVRGIGLPEDEKYIGKETWRIDGYREAFVRGYSYGKKDALDGSKETFLPLVVYMRKDSYLDPLYRIIDEDIRKLEKAGEPAPLKKTDSSENNEDIIDETYEEECFAAEPIRMLTIKTGPRTYHMDMRVEKRGFDPSGEYRINWVYHTDRIGTEEAFLETSEMDAQYSVEEYAHGSFMWDQAEWLASLAIEKMNELVLHKAIEKWM